MPLSEAPELVPIAEEEKIVVKERYGFPILDIPAIRSAH